MANHFLTIDPVLLLDEDQLGALKKLDTAGEAQDYIQQVLGDEFDFSQVFQSTNSEHDLHVHEFMLANESGERKMHKMGVMKTPSDLVAFVTVDDKWMDEHKDIVNKGVHFKMHDRVNPKELKGVNGQTKDGQTTSALRYGHYKTNILMISENEKPISKDETAESMEERAKEEIDGLRKRSFSLDPLRFVKGEHDRVKKTSIDKAFLDGFMKGWDMTDNYKAYKRRSEQASDQAREEVSEPDKKPTQPEETVEIGDALQELSQKVASQEEIGQQNI